MFRVLGVGGYKDSGKTEVVTGIVRELVRRGYRVGTVKHLSRHPTMDREGTDTWKHAEAGSAVTVAVSGEEVSIRDRRKRPKLEGILLSLRGLDFVILEGFKREEVVKVMVARSEVEARELDDGFTAAFVGKGVEGKPLFGKDYRALADLVEERATTPAGGLGCGGCGFQSCREFLLAAASGRKGRRRCAALEGKVELWVGGRRIPLNPFVRKIVSRTVLGMVSSLEGGGRGEVELRVRRE